MVERREKSRRWIWLVVALVASRVVAFGAAPSTRPAVPGEVVSEVCDLWRERDGVYLRVDGRMPVAGKSGEVPAGAQEVVVRVSAAVRGREWPGRWTMVEVAVRSERGQRVKVGFAGEAGAEVTLFASKVGQAGGSAEQEAGVWQRIRLPLGATPGDVVIRAVGSAGLGRVELGKVQLVDDSLVLSGEGVRAERRAGLWRFGQGGVTLPVMAGDGQAYVISEVNAMRAVVSLGGAEVGAVYRTGDAFGVLGAGGNPGWTLTVPEDQGRLDRNTPGDRDGDAFNDLRGAYCLRVMEGVRRLSVNVVPGGNRQRVYVEVANLPPGKVTAIWEGKVLSTPVRLEDGRVLFELPVLAGSSRVDVSVGEQ
jgi:hypothetical protein